MAKMTDYGDNSTFVSVVRKDIGDQLSHLEFNEILDAISHQGSRKNIKTMNLETVGVINCSKDMTVGGTLSVDKPATFKSNIRSSSVIQGAKLVSDGNTEVNQHLVVYKDSYFYGNTQTTGTASFQNDVTVKSGNLSILKGTGNNTGNLEVEYDISSTNGDIEALQGTITAGKDLYAKGVLYSELPVGVSTIMGSVRMGVSEKTAITIPKATLTVEHGQTNLKSTVINGPANITGDSGTLKVSQTAEIQKKLTVHGDIKGDQKLEIDGRIKGNGGLHINGNIKQTDLPKLSKPVLFVDEENGWSMFVKGNAFYEDDVVVGDKMYIHGNFKVNGTSNLVGNVTLDNNLLVKLGATVNGSLTVGTSGGYSSFYNNAIFYLGHNETFYIKRDKGKDNSGNQLADNIIEIKKSVKNADVHLVDIYSGTAIHNILTVDNDTELKQKLTVGGKSLFKGGFDSDDDALFKKNITVKGTSIQEGAVTLLSTLNVKAKATLQNDLQVYKATNIGGSLDVVGASTLKSTLQVDKASLLKGTLTVDGNARLNSALHVTGNSVMQGALRVDGSATLKDTLTVDGASTLQGTLTVDGDTRLKKKLTVDGNAILEGTLSAAGNATFGANATVNGAFGVDGNSRIGKSGEDTTATFNSKASFKDNILTASTSTAIFCGTTVDNGKVVIDSSSLTSRVPTTITGLLTTNNINIADTKQIVIGSTAASNANKIGLVNYEMTSLKNTVDIEGDVHIGSSTLYNNGNGTTSNLDVYGDLNVLGNLDIKKLILNNKDFDETYSPAGWDATNKKYSFTIRKLAKSATNTAATNNTDLVTTNNYVNVQQGFNKIAAELNAIILKLNSLDGTGSKPNIW